MASREPGPRGGACAPAARDGQARRSARTAGVVGHQVGAGGLVDARGGLRGDSVLTGALGRALEPAPTPGPAELLLDASGRVIRKPALH
eukprot:1372274-Prymnesium_polylepis.1